jgi:hypothetical protein
MGVLGFRSGDVCQQEFDAAIRLAAIWTIATMFAQSRILVGALPLVEQFVDASFKLLAIHPQ